MKKKLQLPFLLLLWGCAAEAESPVPQTSVPITTTNESATGNTNTAAPLRFLLNVRAEDNDDYLIDGTDRFGAVQGNDPLITVRIQDTLVFNVDVEDHPFYLKSAAGEGTENALPDIDNNGTSTGNIQWIPNEAREFYFQCAHHWNMGGKIVVNPN